MADAHGGVGVVAEAAWEPCGGGMEAVAETFGVTGSRRPSQGKWWRPWRRLGRMTEAVGGGSPI